MLSRFTPDRKASGAVSRRIEAALDRLADGPVFGLNLFTHVNASAIPLARVIRDVGEVKIEYHLGFIDAFWANEIRVHHAFIPVDHEVRVDPEIERTLPAANLSGSRIGTVAHHGSG